MLTWSTPSFFILEYPSAQCAFTADPFHIPPLPSEDCLLLAQVTDPEAEAALQILAEHLGSRLLVPEVWRDILPQTGLLIPAAISGGFLEDRLKRAAEASPGRCWLLADRFRMYFPLPCPSGSGRFLSALDAERLRAGGPDFYSPEFCCRYCYDYPNGLVLFDTEDSISEKLRLAKEAGFHGALLQTTLT